ncbi:hypothetical protein D3C80_1044300 [compost metagenome]
MRDQLCQSAQVELEHQAQARCAFAGHRHCRMGGDVQRGDQEPGRVIREHVAADDHFLGALHDQHDAWLDDAGDRWGRYVASVDAEVRDACREIASRWRVGADDLAQRGHRVRV